MAVASVVVLVGVVVGLVDPFGKTVSANAGGNRTGYATALAEVARRDLSSQTEVTATLGYAGSYTVVNQATDGDLEGSAAPGSDATSPEFTQLPSVGQVVSQGHVLYRVNDSPVILLDGTTPAYRTLSEGTAPADVTGPDVAELNADLVALGFATSSEISSGSDQFGSWTTYALVKLEKALGITQTGALSLGQAVFLPTAVRVTSVSATLGAPAQAGATVLQGTSTSRQVSIALDTTQEAEVKAGDQVTITLPDNHSTPGVVASVGTVATASAASANGGSAGSPGGGTATITVLVTPTDPTATGSWDLAPVDVTITTATVNGVLVVPVDALLAQPGGGYVVEVVNRAGVHHLESVSLGLFDDADGLVQVSGSSLAAGQHVVVPQS